MAIIKWWILRQKMGDLAMVIYATSRGKEHCTTIYASETKFRKNVNDNQNRNITKWACLFWAWKYCHIKVNERKMSIYLYGRFPYDFTVVSI